MASSKNKVKIASMKLKAFYACLFGNLVDHYDAALYGFLAPIIAPIFFPQYDYIVALMLAYGLLSASIITRPLGTIFFAHIAEKHGANKSLFLSLTGIGLATGAIGLLPTYATIGSFAPIALTLARMLQGFSSAGETTVASMFLIEQTAKTRQGKVNSLYQCSVMLGIILASLAATLVVKTARPEFYWRIPFFLGFISCIVGAFLRYTILPSTQITSTAQPLITSNLANIITKKKLKICAAIFASSFTYLTYAIPFVFMNSFIPQVSAISLADMMMANTALLILDMLILPIFGYLTDRYSAIRVMKMATLSLAITIIPAFLLLANANFLTVCLVRIWIIMLGLAFLAPFGVWLYDQFENKRYLLAGVSYSLGTELFGRSSPLICLWLWHATGSVIAPAVFISCISLSTMFLIVLSDIKVQPEAR